MTQSIQSLFTEISPRYDKANRWLSMGQDLLWRKRAVARLPWDTKTPLQVLDLCAGTLDFGRLLKRRYPQATVHSLDFSLGMLRHGQGKIPVEDKAAFPLYCADAQTLPFTNACFDLVLCAYGMRNIPQQALALREVRRVLSPDGFLGILEFFNPSNLFSKIFYRTYSAYILPTVGGLIARHKTAYRYLHRSIGDYTNLKDYLSFLKTKNFKIIIYQNFIGGISSFILAKKQEDL